MSIGPSYDVLPTAVAAAAAVAATAATVSLRSVSSRLSDEARDDVPLYHGPRVLLFHPPTRRGLPTSSPRLPHLGGPDHLPFCTRRTLWPSSPRRNAPPRPPPSLFHPPHRPLPTRPLPSSSPPALFHLQRRRSHPFHRRAILSLRFTRDLSAFINYIATERCVSLLPGCLAA